jgi:hypothetical protein
LRWGYAGILFSFCLSSVGFWQRHQDAALGWVAVCVIFLAARIPGAESLSSATSDSVALYALQGLGYSVTSTSTTSSATSSTGRLTFNRKPASQINGSTIYPNTTYSPGPGANVSTPNSPTSLLGSSSSSAPASFDTGSSPVLPSPATFQLNTTGISQTLSGSTGHAFNVTALPISSPANYLDSTLQTNASSQAVGLNGTSSTASAGKSPLVNATTSTVASNATASASNNTVPTIYTPGNWTVPPNGSGGYS